MMPMTGQGSGEGRSWSQSRGDQDDQPQVNREAEGLHEPLVLEAPPSVITLTR
jgi:chloride channel 3/4/5